MSYAMAMEMAILEVHKGAESLGVVLNLLIMMEAHQIGGSDEFWRDVSAISREEMLAGRISQEKYAMILQQGIVMGGVPDLDSYHALLLEAVKSAEAGQEVAAYRFECLMHDFAIAGHTPNLYSMKMMMRGIAACAKHGRAVGPLLCHVAFTFGLEASILAPISTAFLHHF